MLALAALAPERVIAVGPTSVLRGFIQMIGVRVDAITTVFFSRRVLGH